MRRLRELMLPLLCLVVFVMPGVAASDDWHCIVEMELPQLRDSVMNIEGEVQATVKIRSDGTAGAVKLNGSAKVLVNEVEYLLKRQTQYSPSCKAQTVSFIFTYVVQGELTTTLSGRVIFRPPN